MSTRKTTDNDFVDELFRRLSDWKTGNEFRDRSNFEIADRTSTLTRDTIVLRTTSLLPASDRQWLTLFSMLDDILKNSKALALFDHEGIIKLQIEHLFSCRLQQLELTKIVGYTSWRVWIYIVYQQAVV